jgi:lipopolysaccharide export system protein LptA
MTGLGRALLLATALICSGPAQGQGLRLASTGGDQAIEVLADNGIEWQRENEILVARGNAVATRGGTTVRGDVLRAYYKKKRGGGTDLTRLDAQGNVVISSKNQKASGETAVYDMEKAVLVISGKKVRFTADKDQLTANRQLEYHEKDLLVVARGEATGIHQGKKLMADVLAAYLEHDKKGDLIARHIQAKGNVFIAVAKDRVHADEGVYDVKSEIAKLSGRVRIRRGKNILAGERAEINMKTGISRLLTAAGVDKKPTRVRGLIQPKRK